MRLTNAEIKWCKNNGVRRVRVPDHNGCAGCKYDVKPHYCSEIKHPACCSNGADRVYVFAPLTSRSDGGILGA